MSAGGDSGGTALASAIGGVGGDGCSLASFGVRSGRGGVHCCSMRVNSVISLWATFGDVLPSYIPP